LTKRRVIDIFSWISVKVLKSFKKCFQCISLIFFNEFELLFQYISTSFIKIQHFESSVESVITAGWIAQLTKRPVINIYSWGGVKFLKSFKKCFECIYLYFFNDLQLLFQYISSFSRLGFLLTFTDNELMLPVSWGSSKR